MRIINKSTTNKINTIDTEISILQERISQLEYQLLLISSEKKSRNRILDKYTIEKDPIMTFCMPTYNGEKYIERALDSILMQDTTYNYKIWIIDDHSTDHTVDIVKEYMKIYPQRIMLDVNKVNEKGLTAAPKIYNNVRTKYWMNFDQDDYWLNSDKLERALTYMELHDECSLYSSNIYIRHYSELISGYRGQLPNFRINFCDYPLNNVPLLQTSATIFRNSFTKHDLEHINSFVNTDKHFCIVGDTFRNLFALTKGYCFYENSIDSVYNWTDKGVWSSLNSAQEAFYNLQYYYGAIEFFEEDFQKKHMKNCVLHNLEILEKLSAIDMLKENEYSEYLQIKSKMQSQR